MAWFLLKKVAKNRMGLRMTAMYEKELVNEKPIYVGASFLDLGKLCLMDFSLQHNPRDL